MGMTKDQKNLIKRLQCAVEEKGAKLDVVEGSGGIKLYVAGRLIGSIGSGNVSSPGLDKTLLKRARQAASA